MGAVVSIARYLRAHRQGSNWRCACPLDCGYMLSLAEGEGGKLLAYCHGGCDFAAILAALVGYGLLDDDDGANLPHESPVRKSDIADRKFRIEGACRIYSQSADAPQIETYLRSRAIALSSPVLRFCQSAPHRLGTRRPAMVAPIVDINGQQTGAHLTYLRSDGTGKADLPKEFQRECRGVIGGGVIRLATHDPECELLVGEGVETALSAMEIFKRPGWAAVYAGNLKEDLMLPPEVRRVVITADNDESGTGQKNALAAKQRWLSQGRAVRIVIPPRIGTDFNDFLMERINGAG